MSQNTEALKALGFQPMPNLREFVWRGKHQRFVAVTNDDSTPPFVSMFLVSKQRDQREGSPRKGHYFRDAICDCTKDKSVQRAIKKFDVPDDCLIVSQISVIRKY